MLPPVCQHCQAEGDELETYGLGCVKDADELPRHAMFNTLLEIIIYC